ncbi:class I SAM-dependent DNA methyltransferase [Streptomyces sp. PSRA5]|uniref:class I SAM-dependent DNA methyltransferase n=1 Tax=Streptomyces panacea TaxID=3035064 RepID=UPI00339C5694
MSPSERNPVRPPPPFGASTTQEIKAALWQAADRLRGSVDAAEYKEYVLGLIFLKYVSDAFEEYRSERRERLAAEGFDEDRFAEGLEEREFIEAGVIWVPRTARWSWIVARANTTRVGELIDEAMNAITEANPSLAGALPTIFRRGTVDQRRLAEVVDLIGRVRIDGTWDRSARDVLGEVFEYFLDNFARAEGKRGGEFYTARSVCRLVVGILEPRRGRVYDPACGSGGMLVQADRYVEAHGGNPRELAFYGQEINERTWRLARMNLAVHGMEGDLGAQRGDTLADDQHPELKADFVLAHPPFNVLDWARNEADPRWVYGVPPPGNANYAWLQHAISKLSERGTAGIVLANGSMASRSPSERQIRRALVEADLVASVVALPGQLFHSTQIPACLWVLTKDKSADRRDRILFIDAREMGVMVSRTERELSDEDLAKITGSYHMYRDEPGFCVSAGVETVREHEYALTPGRYVGAAPVRAESPESPEPRAGTERLTKDLYGVFN